MEACEFFKVQENEQGQGSCFMVLGCIYASQSTNELSKQTRQHLLESLVYVIEAEKLQNDMLDSQLMDEKVSTHHDENLAVHINESQVILAYRYFTHAIITANYFMLHHEASSENQEMISNKFKTKERIKSASKKAKRKLEKKKKTTVEPVNLNGLWGEITSQVKLANATRS